MRAVEDTIIFREVYLMLIRFQTRREGFSIRT